MAEAEAVALEAGITVNNLEAICTEIRGTPEAGMAMASIVAVSAIFCREFAMFSVRAMVGWNFS